MTKQYKLTVRLLSKQLQKLIPNESKDMYTFRIKDEVASVSSINKKYIEHDPGMIGFFTMGEKISNNFNYFVVFSPEHEEKFEDMGLKVLFRSTKRVCFSELNNNPMWAFFCEREDSYSDSDSIPSDEPPGMRMKDFE